MESFLTLLTWYLLHVSSCILWAWLGTAKYFCRKSIMLSILTVNSFIGSIAHFDVQWWSRIKMFPCKKIYMIYDENWKKHKVVLWIITAYWNFALIGNFYHSYIITSKLKYKKTYKRTNVPFWTAIKCIMIPAQNKPFRTKKVLSKSEHQVKRL